jgi:hypothetical protein
MFDAMYGINLNLNYDITIMIFLTGCTGYVGKHLLRYLCLTSQKIRVCIRDKELTGKQRFQKEIIEHGLFADPVIQNNLKNVEVIEKDLLELTEEDIEGTVIHCAANVKFTAPLELLLEENVEGLKKIYSLTKEKFIHISTCYVHPKQNGKSEKIKSNLSKKKFICEYAYTKYLAEQYLYDKSNVTIIRLSCVGAPIEKLTPMRGGAHLAILELIERSTLPDLWLPEHFVFSSVPVDIICKEIIKELDYQEKELRILQYCAPKDNLTYNISSDEFSKGKKINTMIWKGLSFETFTLWMNFFYWFIPSLLKKILDANQIISHVSKNIAFESSIELPNLTPQQYNDITYEYIQQLVKNKSSKSYLPYLYCGLTYLKKLLFLVVDYSLLEE